jgi:hypothetical protein
MTAGWWLVTAWATAVACWVLIGVWFEWADRRSCVTCRGVVPVVLATEGEHLCHRHRCQLDRIADLEKEVAA